MLVELIAMYSSIAGWLNDNQGVVGLGIFIVTLIFGWLSGIFSALRRRPKFKIRLIEGPTFVCTVLLGKKHKDYDAHRTCVALYLHITNVGSAASSIDTISVAYHWKVKRFTKAWFRYGVGWFWLHDQVAAINDFQVKIGENVKFYPFLTQTSTVFSTQTSTFLEPGKMENGVVYFEQPDSWGGCFPANGPKGVRIKVGLRDVFGAMHVARFNVEHVSLEYARKFNPSFGKTFAELRNEPLPHDTVDDSA